MVTYAEAAFEVFTFKFIENDVKRISKLRGLTGNKLMMAAFNEQAPVVHLNGMAIDSDTDEQLTSVHVRRCAVRDPQPAWSRDRPYRLTRPVP
jgi:hypothetical protein